MQVTADMTIMNVLKAKKEAIEIFAKHGITGCAMCHASTAESLADGAAAHGIDVTALLEDLNKLDDLEGAE